MVSCMSSRYHWLHANCTTRLGSEPQLQPRPENSAQTHSVKKHRMDKVWIAIEIATVTSTTEELSPQHKRQDCSPSVPNPKQPFPAAPIFMTKKTEHHSYIT